MTRIETRLAKSLKRGKPTGKNLVAIDGTLDKVDRLRIEVHEKGRNAEPFALKIAHKDAVRERVACSNPLCYDGGFSLGDLLRDVVRDRQEEFIGTGFCTGQEGNPEEAGPHPSCATRFEIQANLKFR